MLKHKWFWLAIGIITIGISLALARNATGDDDKNHEALDMPIYYTVEQEPLQNKQVQRTPYEEVVYWLDYYEVNKELGLCIVNAEIGFNPSAQNKTSSAAGLWQFIRSTFNSTAIRMGHSEWNYEEHRYNTEINAQMGAWLLKTDGYGHWVVWPKCI